PPDERAPALRSGRRRSLRRLQRLALAEPDPAAGPRFHPRQATPGREGGAARPRGLKVAGWVRIGEPPITVRLRRQANARRLVLRVAAEGEPVLTAPVRCRPAELRCYLDTHESWLRARLAARPAPVPLGEGARLPVGGREVVLQLGPRVALRDDGVLELPGPEPLLPSRAAGF